MFLMNNFLHLQNGAVNTIYTWEYKQARSDPRDIFAKCFLVFVHKYIFFSIVLFGQEDLYIIVSFPVVKTHCDCIFHSPVAGFSLLVFEVSWSHTTTRHSL